MNIYGFIVLLSVAGAKRIIKVADSEIMSEEERLFTHLFRRYNNRIRPVRNWTDPVNVSLTFSLMQIHHLDEKAQVLKTYGWLIAEWTDVRLTWSPDQFDNLTQFVVDSTLIWTPELALINAVEYQFPDFSQYRAILNKDGQVRWEPAGVFETSCNINITFYPYDTQDCTITFGTWSYTIYQLNYTNSSETVILDDYKTSGEWSIMSTWVTRQEFSYSGNPLLVFSKVSAKFSLIRRHRYFTLNLILPCAMLSSLTLITFLSPPDQGEKISLGISILLSFSVFMLSLSENLPKTSETIPLFGIYTTFVMLMNTSSVMLTVLVLNLHHRNECRPVPRWLRKLVLEGLARLVCMYSKETLTIFPQDRRKSSLFLPSDFAAVGRGYSLTTTAEPPSVFKKKSGSASNKRVSNCTTDVKRSSEPSHYNSTSASSSCTKVPSCKPTGSGRMSSSLDRMLSVSGGPNDETNRKFLLSVNHVDENCESFKTTTAASSGCGDERVVMPASDVINLEMQEWKQLARVMDRLFFWMTLTALISVSVVLSCLRLTWDHN